MKKIWTSQLPKGLKLRFFHAAIETILLYGCESWTHNKAMTKSINGCYTRMLRMEQNAPGGITSPTWSTMATSPY